MTDLNSYFTRGVACNGTGCDAEVGGVYVRTCDETYTAQAVAQGWTVWVGRSRRHYCPDCASKSGHKMWEITDSYRPGGRYAPSDEDVIKAEINKEMTRAVRAAYTFGPRIGGARGIIPLAPVSQQEDVTEDEPALTDAEKADIIDAVTDSHGRLAGAFTAEVLDYPEPWTTGEVHGG